MWQVVADSVVDVAAGRLVLRFAGQLLLSWIWSGLLLVAVMLVNLSCWLICSVVRAALVNLLLPLVSERASEQVVNACGSGLLLIRLRIQTNSQRTNSADDEMKLTDEGRQREREKGGLLLVAAAAAVVVVGGSGGGGDDDDEDKRKIRPAFGSGVGQSSSGNTRL